MQNLCFATRALGEMIFLMSDWKVAEAASITNSVRMHHQRPKKRCCTCFEMPGNAANSGVPNDICIFLP